MIPYLGTEHLKNPTLSGGTYLYSVYKEVLPRDKFSNLKIYCRLSLNYQIDHHNYTTLSGILEDCNVSGCEKENFVLIAKEMGMILSDVFEFPEATRVQRRENGNRTWKYPLSWLLTGQLPLSIKSPYLRHFRHRVLRCT